MKKVQKDINTIVELFKENLNLDLVVDFEYITARLKKDSPRSRLGYKSLWAYKFKTIEKLLEYVKSQYDYQLAAKHRKEEEKLAKKQKSKEELQSVNVGDIFLCSWGYEQTNVNFYKLIEKKGSKGIFQEVGYNHVRETSWCSADVEIDETQIIGEPFVKMLKGSAFKMNSFSHAYKVDKNQTFYKSWGY